MREDGRQGYPRPPTGHAERQASDGRRADGLAPGTVACGGSPKIRLKHNVCFGKDPRQEPLTISAIAQDLAQGTAKQFWPRLGEVSPQPFSSIASASAQGSPLGWLPLPETVRIAIFLI